MDATSVRSTRATVNLLRPAGTARRPNIAFLTSAPTFSVFHRPWMPPTDPVTEAVAGIVTPFAMVAAAVSVLHALGAAHRPVFLAIPARHVERAGA